MSDGAIIELYTLQALGGRLLVGPYSRFGWHHPGPVYFYFQAPFYWLSGFRTTGLQVGALVINVAAVALVAWTLVSSGAPLLAAIVTSAMALFSLRASDIIVSVWNPHVIVLPLLAYVVVAAVLAGTGRASLSLWLVLLGSFLVQTHLAMAPIVAVVGGIAAAAQWRAIRRLLPFQVLLGFVLWMPPLIEQLTGHPGNFAKITAFFLVGGSGQPVGIAAGAWSAALVAAVRPDFAVASGADFTADPSWPVAVAVMECAALCGTAYAIRRRDRSAAWLAVVCALATIVAFAATTRIRDQIVDHEIFWITAIGVLNLAVLLGTMMIALGASRSMSHHIGAWSSAVAVTVVAIAGLHGVWQTLHRARTIDDHAVDVIAEQLRAVPAQRPLIHIEPQVWPIAAGALLEQRKANAAFAIDTQWVPMFGDVFTSDGHEDADVTIGGTLLQPFVIRNR